MQTTCAEMDKDRFHRSTHKNVEIMGNEKDTTSARRRYPLLEEVGRLPSRLDLDEDYFNDNQHEVLKIHLDPKGEDCSSRDDQCSSYLGREDDASSSHGNASSTYLGQADDTESSHGDATSTYLGQGGDESSHGNARTVGQEDESSYGDASSTFLGQGDESESSHDDASSTYLGKGDDSTDDGPCSSYISEEDESSHDDASSTYLGGDDDPSGHEDANSSFRGHDDSSGHDDFGDSDLCNESHALAWEPYREKKVADSPVAKSSNDNDVNDTSRIDNDDQDFVMEVAPNVFKTIRGANHVIRAWQNGDCIEAMCFVCDIRLASTDDCEGVACPVCLSVSPVEGHRKEFAVGQSYVGIGLRID